MNKIIIFLAFIASAGFAADLKHEDWHKPLREYEPRDSVVVLAVDYSLIQKIRVGMTFDEVEHIVGFAPVDYYIHPDYAILETKVGDEYYEVAFLHKKSRTVEAISYRFRAKAPNNAPPLELSLTVGEFRQSFGRWPTNYAELCSYTHSAHDILPTNYDRVDFTPRPDGVLEISAFASGITNHMICHPSDPNQK